jgi:hypothetical protein
MRTRLALCLLCALGCTQPSDPGGAYLSLQLQLPVAAVNITSVQVIIRDAAGSCNGADAQGGAELVRQTVTLGETAHIEVSAGSRVVSAIALDGTAAVARGCQVVTVTAGNTTPVSIQLAEYPPGVDGAPDGPIFDAPPIPDGQAPGEDDCDTPGTIALGGTATHSAALSNDEIVPSCGVAGGGDVFYLLTLAQPSNVDITVGDTTGSHAVAVYSGTCGALAELACANAADPDVLTDVPLPAGTYYVVVDETTAGSGGTFTLMVTATPVPALEDCANPGVLALAGTGGGNYGGAVDNTAGSCGGSGGGDQVSQLTVPDAQYVRVNANGSGSFATYVRDVCNDPTSEVGTPICDGTSPGQIDLGLVQGDYFVWVDRTGGGNSAYTLSSTVLAPPNDACPGTAITPGTATRGTLIGANNTAPAASCGGTSNDVFYQFTTAMDTHLVATVTSTSAATNPVLSLRTTCTDAASELGCSNAMTGATETLDIPTLPMGGPYFLVVDSQGAPSSFTVTVTLTVASAANDTCTSPRSLSPPGATGESVQFSADDEIGAGECNDAGATDTVYSFTATAGQNLTLTVTPTSFDAAIYVRSATCTGGTQIGCADAGVSGAAETITATALAGGTYFLFVEKKSGTGNAFDIVLSLI